MTQPEPKLRKKKRPKWRFSPRLPRNLGWRPRLREGLLARLMLLALFLQVLGHRTHNNRNSNDIDPAMVVNQHRPIRVQSTGSQFRMRLAGVKDWRSLTAKRGEVRRSPLPGLRHHLQPRGPCCRNSTVLMLRNTNLSTPPRRSHLPRYINNHNLNNSNPQHNRRRTLEVEEAKEHWKLVAMSK